MTTWAEHIEEKVSQKVSASMAVPDFYSILEAVRKETMKQTTLALCDYLATHTDQNPMDIAKEFTAMAERMSP